MVMTNLQNNGQINLTPGSKIVGKWNRIPYQIKYMLGSGANGTVYLASAQNGNVAIKISKESTNITNEVNVLKKLSQVQGSILGPSFIDVDDFTHPYTREPLYFYVMDYIEGKNVFTFLQKNELEWSCVLIAQLLSKLEILHEQGYIFGDLKTDNLIVTTGPHSIQWIDVGGVTPIGRAVKEFTEFFDRGYWELGTRKAEPTYDLFACAMIFIHLHCKKQYTKNGKGINQLEEIINQNKSLTLYKTVLLKALTGKYTSAAQMKKDLLMCEQERVRKQSVHYPQTSQNNKIKPAQHSQSASRIANKKNKKKHYWFETIILVLLALLGYSLYFYYQL